jgi:uncharacterized phage protein gp47/JayE
MAFQRPTLSDLIERTKADFQSRLTGGGSLLKRSVAAVIARVHAGAMHLLYGYAAFMAKQLMPDTAEKEYLRRWANIWKVTPKAASFAQCTVTFSGTDGVAIPVGTELTRSDGVTYITDSTVTTAGGLGATVTATAKVAGAESSLSGGEILSMSSPIAGISSNVPVSSSGLLSGSDAEDDSSLLGRLLTRIQMPPNGGSKNDYATWAKEVAGVTRAWCYPNYYGTGTVGLTFVRDNATSIIPNPTQVATVQAYIDDASRRPVAAALTVFAPTAVPLNFTISGISDATIRAAIQAELADLILREAIPGGTLLLSHINEAISVAKGETDHVLTAPSANVTTAAGNLTTMGTITWV